MLLLLMLIYLIWYLKTLMNVPVVMFVFGVGDLIKVIMSCNSYCIVTCTVILLPHSVNGVLHKS